MVKICGHDVEFPEGKQPFSPQLAVMSKCLVALTKSQNALLESPTGTGKTLALLSAALSWQKKNHMEALAAFHAGNVDCGRGGEDDDNFEMCAGTTTTTTTAAAAAAAVAGDERSAPSTPSRKNKRGRKDRGGQLAQVIGELRNVHASLTDETVMCVLGSRSHLCTNKKLRTKVSEGRISLEEGCRDLVKQQQCPQQQGMFRVKDRLAPILWDMEDAVGAALKVNGCAYYGSRELFQEASLVLCPYNFVLDANIRQALSIDIEDSVIIFDEAHNLEDTCRSSASLSCAHSALSLAVDQLTLLADSGLPAFVALRDLLTALMVWFDRAWSILTPEDCKRGSNIWLGIEVLELFAEEMQLTPDTLPIYVEHLKTVVSDDDTANLFTGGDKTPPRIDKVRRTTLAYEEEGGAGGDATAVAADAKSSNSPDKAEEAGLSASTRFVVERLLMVYRYLAAAPEDFRLVLEDMRSSGSGGDKPTRGRRTSRGAYVRESEPVLHVWCLNAAVAFRAVAAQTHSVLLASGTLSPLESFAGELGVDFQVQVEAAHVIDTKKQVFAAVVNSCNNMSLDARYTNQQNESYQDAVFTTVCTTAALTPGGLLCFLPSYGLMDRLLQRWEHNGQLDNLRNSHVPVFVEPKAAADLEGVMAQFYRAVDSRCGPPPPPPPPPHAGAGWGTGKAVLFAVARGKVSEGIDFSDRYARCVVVVGIPFSSTQDVQVRLKREHQDAAHKRDPRLISGSVWYTQQAFRAINQSIGRCIRHRRDFGSILLCDPRYSEDRSLGQLSKWTRPIVQRYDALESMLIPLRSFYAELDHGFRKALASGEFVVKSKSVPEDGEEGEERGSGGGKGTKRGRKDTVLLAGQMTLSGAFRNAQAQVHARSAAADAAADAALPPNVTDRASSRSPVRGGGHNNSTCGRGTTTAAAAGGAGGAGAGEPDENVALTANMLDTEMSDRGTWEAKGAGGDGGENRPMGGWTEKADQCEGDVHMCVGVDDGECVDGMDALETGGVAIDDIPCTSLSCCCQSLRYDPYKHQALRELGRCWGMGDVRLGVLPEQLSLLRTAFGQAVGQGQISAGGSGGYAGAGADREGDGVDGGALVDEGHVVDVGVCATFLDERMTSAAAREVGLEVELCWMPQDGVFYRALLLRTGAASSDRRIVAVRALAANASAADFTGRGWLLPCVLRVMTGMAEPPPPSQELADVRSGGGRHDEPRLANDASNRSGGGGGAGEGNVDDYEGQKSIAESIFHSVDFLASIAAPDAVSRRAST